MYWQNYWAYGKMFTSASNTASWEPHKQSSSVVQKPTMNQKNATAHTVWNNAGPGHNDKAPHQNKNHQKERSNIMAHYKPGTHINLKKKEEYSLFVKISNIVWPYAIGILAAYGFIDLLLTANGF